MTLDDLVRLATDAATAANTAASRLYAAREFWLEPGKQAAAIQCEQDGKDAARRAAILLETIARE